MDNGPHEMYTAHKGIINSWLMTQRNDKQFEEMFGKCSFATNEYEFYTRAWVIEFLGETFIMHSSERGSSYEIVTSQEWEVFSKNKVLGRIIVAFAEDLVQKQRNLEINQANIADWAKLENKMQKEVDL